MKRQDDGRADGMRAGRTEGKTGRRKGGKTDGRIVDRSGIAANNNRKFIRSLAYRSVQSSKMRNVFVVLTIALSVSLLMVMALFYMGLSTEKKRAVAEVQHAIYMDVTEGQMAEMAADDRTGYVLSMKQGQGVEIDGNMVQPVAYGSEPLKAEDVSVETVTPSEGRAPETADEIMLSDAYCKLAGIVPEPGEKVKFQWLDGTVEEYVLSGVFHTAEHLPVYTVLFSEEYARTGSQLKEAPWEAVVRFKGAEAMTQPEFEDVVYTFGADMGLDRPDMNINNNFLDSLSGGEKDAQAVIVVGGAGIGVLFVSVLVIYSVFYLAIVGRIRQFGQLRTIGMTGKQIRRMVRAEGLILSAAGIPAGLLIGGVVSYFIRPGGWSWRNMLVISAVVTIADILTVLISLHRPAKIAAGISPAEAARYTGYEKKKKRSERRRSRRSETAERRGQKNGAHEGKVKKSGTAQEGTAQEGTAARRAEGIRELSRKITPSAMAFMNTSRNKKKAAMTMLSLGIGGVLFMLAAFMTVSTDLEEYTRVNDYKFGDFIITYSYNVTQTAEHGQIEVQAEKPIGQELISAVESIDGVKKVSPVREMYISCTSPEYISVIEAGTLQKERAKELEKIKHEGELSYEKLVENDGIIFNARDGWKEVYGWAPQAGDKIELSWYDGQQEREKTFTVMGVLDRADIPNTKPGDKFGEFLIPEDTIKDMAGSTDLTASLVVETDSGKDTRIESELTELLKDYPHLSLGTLREEMEVTEVQFTTLFMVMMGMSIFIICFALLNLLNTLITNMLTRNHELAMLQSVGMTKKQVIEMLRTEALVLAGSNLLITLIAGTAAGALMIRLMRYFEADYMHFVFPVWFFAGYAVFIIAVPMLVTEYMVSRFGKQTLVERLRN